MEIAVNAFLSELCPFLTDYFINIKYSTAESWHPHMVLLSPFPTMFFTSPKTECNYSVTFILLSASAFSLNQSKNLLFCKEYRKSL